MNFIKNNVVGLVAIVLSIIAVLGISSVGGGKNLGAQVQNDLWYHTGGIVLTRDGTGTTINNLISSTCSMVATSFYQTATTTQNYSCAATGVKPNDVVVSDPSANQSVGFGGWVITSAAASTTAGYIQFSVVNLSGATAPVPSSIASSTEFIDLR